MYVPVLKSRGACDGTVDCSRGVQKRTDGVNAYHAGSRLSGNNADKKSKQRGEARRGRRFYARGHGFRAAAPGSAGGVCCWTTGADLLSTAAAVVVDTSIETESVRRVTGERERE